MSRSSKPRSSSAISKSRMRCARSIAPHVREFPVSELGLGVKCGRSGRISGMANRHCGDCSDCLSEVAARCGYDGHGIVVGAEHLLAARAKDAATGAGSTELVDWYKDCFEIRGVSGQTPAPAIAAALWKITIHIARRDRKAGTTRIEACTNYAEKPRSAGSFDAGRGLRSGESTTGLVGTADGRGLTTGNGNDDRTTIAPVISSPLPIVS